MGSGDEDVAADRDGAAEVVFRSPIVRDELRELDPVDLALHEIDLKSCMRRRVETHRQHALLRR